MVSVVEPFPLWELQVDASRPMCPSLSLSTESFPLEWASVSSECVGWDTVEISSPEQTDWLLVILGEALLWVSPSSLCVVPFPVSCLEVIITHNEAEQLYISHLSCASVRGLLTQQGMGTAWLSWKSAVLKHGYCWETFLRPIVLDVSA